MALTRKNFQKKRKLLEEKFKTLENQKVQLQLEWEELMEKGQKFVYDEERKEQNERRMTALEKFIDTGRYEQSASVTERFLSSLHPTKLGGKNVKGSY